MSNRVPSSLSREHPDGQAVNSSRARSRRVGRLGIFLAFSFPLAVSISPAGFLFQQSATSDLLPTSLRHGPGQSRDRQHAGGRGP